MTPEQEQKFKTLQRNRKLKGVAAVGATAGGAMLLKHLMTKKAADANRLVEALKKIDPALLASIGTGAAVGGVGTYLASRPQDNGKSKAEEQLESQVKSHEEKPADTMGGKMHQANTKMMHGYSQAFRDHPVRAGVMGALTGGTLGYGLGRMAGANKPSIDAIKAALRGGK